MGIREGSSDRSAVMFDQFCRASSLRGTLNIFQQICEELHIDRTDHATFFPALRTKLRSWKAVSLWNRLEKRAAQDVYQSQKICSGHRAMVIGAGPCGLRTAIELALLGCKVVVVEKRDSFSRNNVIHLWPFVIHDLRSLGAKKFYGKFCSGSIDHISIKQVQLILTKVSLLLGVEIHVNTSFENVIHPDKDCGWKVSVLPSDHPINLYEFDILIGADGRRNTLDGFPRKEFRGKLAIGITANFVNGNSKAEAQVEEISGLSYVYNQRFFKDLKLCSGIDLENIVYYKDETHYFVMTAKKTSLLSKGVLLRDYAEISNLLMRDNVNQTALLSFAREAAKAATNGQLPDLEFARNSHGMEDVAMFDFTSLFAAENASRILTRKGYPLVMALVGDSLLEPFWPTGSGCGRGFLSSLDVAWMIRQWSIDLNPLDIIAERETLYQFLSQTTPNNVSKDFTMFTINPKSRYQQLLTSYMKPYQVRQLYDDDGTGLKNINLNLRHEEKPKITKTQYFGDYDRILKWFQLRLMPYENMVQIHDLSASWYNGKGLYCILHHFHPELVDLKVIQDLDPNRIYQRACDIIEKVYEVSPMVTANEIAESAADRMKMFLYLTEVCQTMAIKHRRHHNQENEAEQKREKPMEERKVVHRAPQHRLFQKPRELPRIPKRPTTMMTDESKQAALDVFLQVTGARKEFTKSPEVGSSQSKVKQMQTDLFHQEIQDECGDTVADVKRRIRDNSKKEIRSPTRRYSDMPLNRPGIDDLIKQMSERQEKRRLEANELFEKELERIRSPNQDSVREIASAKSEMCHFCKEDVQPLEKFNAEGCTFHKSCLRCSFCRAPLSLDAYAFKYQSDGEAKFFCFQHVGKSMKGDGTVSKRKEGFENGKVELKTPVDSPDSAPERAEFDVRRKSVIDDNSWNLRDFLYSADMDEEYASPDEELSEESESEESSDEESESDKDEENNLRGALSPSRGKEMNLNAKMNFFSQPSQPVRIDPWEFFEREMGFKLVEKEKKEDFVEVSEGSPEWDESDLNPSDIIPGQDENSNPADPPVPIDFDNADFIDDSDNSLNNSTDERRKAKVNGESEASDSNPNESDKTENFGKVNLDFLEKYRPRSNSDDGIIYLPRNLYGDTGDSEEQEQDGQDGGGNNDVKILVTEDSESTDEPTDAESPEDEEPTVTEVPEPVPPKPKPIDLAILEKYKIERPTTSAFLKSPLRVGSVDLAGQKVKHYSIVGQSPVRSPAPKSPASTDFNDALKLLLGGKK